MSAKILLICCMLATPQSHKCIMVDFVKAVQIDRMQQFLAEIGWDYWTECMPEDIIISDKINTRSDKPKYIQLTDLYIRSAQMPKLTCPKCSKKFEISHDDLSRSLDIYKLLCNECKFSEMNFDLPEGFETLFGKFKK